jgi:hypothetical protein
MEQQMDHNGDMFGRQSWRQSNACCDAHHVDPRAPLRYPVTEVRPTRPRGDLK